jgi:hypothetical protein
LTGAGVASRDIVNADIELLRDSWAQENGEPDSDHRYHLRRRAEDVVLKADKVYAGKTAGLL